MLKKNWKFLDEHLRLRLADLEPRLFELFFLHFLRAGISLTIERHGQQVTKRVISAETYAAGSGRAQKGIDLRVVVEGGEVWVFQCKRHKTWSPAQTREAIREATQYQANHYFLVVTCDPHEEVQDEIHKHPNWTFWNLDTIGAEFRLRVPPSKHAQVLFFLPPEELKRFVPFTTEALMTPEQFFERFLGQDKPFRHDWKLVGRENELQALRDFVASAHVVQILTAKGGDGKSRLLWEFCRTLKSEQPDAEVLCLNPHRGGDDFSFAFTGNPPRRVILVDDAHRTEQVPLQLLALLREDSKSRGSKIVLATRPQGVESLAHKLYETGLANSLAPQLSLPSLKKAEVKRLAAEALGETLAEHAGKLAELTRDSPFLTVVAGDLLRQGRLEWKKWTSDQEFRQHAFREFEQQNLETVPEADRSITSGLMRLVALLAPVSIGPQFDEAAARCLGITVFALETQLLRLRQSELVAGRDDSLRIVPDLFADFLVYDTCYEPTTRKPGFVSQILHEFANQSAALLRNLSEATWIAQANGVSYEALLQPLLDRERRRFEAASFYQRAEILRHWSGFSVYLPAESLQLARNALDLKTAPEFENDQVFGSLPRYDSHAYVCEQIPALLKPVAKYHDRHRRAALDLLWELGLAQSWAGIGSNQSHPWGVIADIVKFEPKKPVSVTMEALAWLDTQARKPETLQALESSTPILRTLLGPCFERFVEFSWIDGHSLTWCDREVSLPNTQPIRDRALVILAWVIEHGSWLAALDALSALETAIRPVAPTEARRVTNEAKFRAEWSPERLKGLAVYETALEKHSNVAVRCEIRQTLKRNLNYEEDPGFAKECRRVLANIQDDLALRVAVVISSQGAFEFEEEIGLLSTAEQHDQVRTLWNEKVRDTASQLAASFPAADALFGFLQPLACELAQAGNHLFLHPLFAGLAQTAPNLALGLATQILAANSETPLARDWPALLANSSQVGEEQKVELFKLAARSQIAGASAALIRNMSWHARQNQSLSDAAKDLLLEIAVRARPDEALYLLQLVEWSSEANLPWAFRILETLPIREIAPRMLEQVLEALVPYRERKTSPPRATVQHVLKELVEVRELDLYHHSREWNVLFETYPREIYDLVHARIAYAASGKAEAEYRPVPSGYRSTFHLSALAKETDFPAICDELWKRVSTLDEKTSWYWVQLFQAVVFEDPSLWPSRTLNAINATRSEDALLRLAQLLKFEGSLIIFRFPEITRAFFKRALALGRDELCKKVRAWLYSGCGPQVRSYSRGSLDQESDYVEAEAAKAAEAHASDELLGPFYRWIVEVEQKNRLTHKLQAEAHMASLD